MLLISSSSARAIEGGANSVLAPSGSGGRDRLLVGRSGHTRASVGLGVLRVYVRLSLYERFSAYGYIRAQ